MVIYLLNNSRENCNNILFFKLHLICILIEILFVLDGHEILPSKALKFLKN